MEEIKAGDIYCRVESNSSRSILIVGVLPDIDLIVYNVKYDGERRVSKNYTESLSELKKAIESGELLKVDKDFAVKYTEQIFKRLKINENNSQSGN